MSSLGQWFFEREKASIMATIRDRAPYTATVVAVPSAGTVRVTDPFTGTAELEELTLLGARPAVGDQVMLTKLVDGERVAMAIPSYPMPMPPVAALGGWLSTRWFGTQHTLGWSSIGTGTLAANVTYAMPFLCPQDIGVDAIAFNVTTAVAGATALVGIYASDPSSKFASGAAIASGAVGNVATTGVKTWGVSVALEAGKLYWLALVASAAISVSTFVPAYSLLPWPSFTTNPASGVMSNAAGSLTLSVPNNSFTSIHPVIQLRAS